MPDDISFAPFTSFLEAQDELARFFDLSVLSYRLAQQLLFLQPKDTLPDLSSMNHSLADLSYGEHDVSVSSTELSCEWIDLAEYALRSDSSIEELTASAIAGTLGPMETEAAVEQARYIWPPEFAAKSRDDLPETGLKSFNVRVEVKGQASTPIFDLEDAESVRQAQKTYLILAHALGKPDELSERAASMLARTSLLALWTNFEVFLRGTVAEMIRRHPKLMIVGKRGKTSIDYADLFDLSQDLSSVDDLRANIIEREIESLRSDGRSVHGLINFLRSEITFDKDPYEAWYQWRGERRKVDYMSIMDLKDTRNALIHEGEWLDDDDANSSEHQFREAKLKVDSIVHRIGSQVADGNYTVRGK